MPGNHPTLYLVVITNGQQKSLISQAFQTSLGNKA